MKWVVVVISLNVGLVFMCFGSMAQQNQCSKHFQDTFYGAGRAALWATGFVFTSAVIATIVEWKKRKR